MKSEWRVVFSKEHKPSRPAVAHLLMVPENQNDSSAMLLTRRLCAPQFVINYSLSAPPTTHGLCKVCMRRSKQATPLSMKEWHFAP